MLSSTLKRPWADVDRGASDVLRLMMTYRKHVRKRKRYKFVGDSGHPELAITPAAFDERDYVRYLGVD